MTRFASLAFAFALASCGGNLAPVAASLTPAALSPDTVSTITGLCRQAQPLVGLAGLTPSAPAQEVAAFVGAYCGQMLAGQVPPTTDANTVNWLGQNLAGLRAQLGR